MKIIFFSDLHAHQFKEFSHVTAGGINSRLQSCLDIVNQVSVYAIENNIDTVVFGGDLFHTRPSVDTLTYNLTINALIKLSASVQLYIIPGNHDCYSKDDKHHSLEILKPITNIFILDGSINSIKLSQDTVLHSIGYNDSLDVIKENIKSSFTNKKEDHTNILLLHTEIQGSVTPTGYKFEEGIKSKWLSKHFDWTFCGHIHRYQKFQKNVFNIGSPLHQDWGDKGDKKGFLVLDTKAKSLERVYTEYPEFREIEEIDICIHKGDKDNFYKIKFEDALDDSSVKELKKDLPYSILDYEVKSTYNKRSELTLDMGVDKMVEEYIKNYEGKLNKDELIKVGMGLLK